MSKQNDNTKPSHENRPVMLEWPGKGEVGECTGCKDRATASIWWNNMSKLHCSN